jgi:hypothetical protein
MAASLACLPGSLRAANSPDLVYRIHIDGPGARVEWSTSGHILLPANWEVTVTVDEAQCAVYCEYRLKRDASGRPAGRVMAPPVVTVQVSYDAVSQPQTVTIDPGGVELPTVVRRYISQRDNPYVPGRKWFAAAPKRATESTLAERLLPQLVSANRRILVPGAALPLRI